MELTTTQAEYNTAVVAVVAAAVSTYTPSGDCAAAAAAVITSMIRGRPITVVTPMGTAAGAATAESAADTKIATPPADPLSIVVVNPDYNEACWSTHRYHCGYKRKVVEDFRATPPPSAPTTRQSTDAHHITSK